MGRVGGGREGKTGEGEGKRKRGEGRDGKGGHPNILLHPQFRFSRGWLVGV